MAQDLADIKKEVYQIVECMISSIAADCDSGNEELAKYSGIYNKRQQAVHFSSPLNTYLEYSLPESSNSIFSTQELLEDIDDSVNNSQSYEQKTMQEYNTNENTTENDISQNCLLVETSSNNFTLNQNFSNSSRATCEIINPDVLVLCQNENSTSLKEKDVPYTDNIAVGSKVQATIREINTQIKEIIQIDAQFNNETINDNVNTQDDVKDSIKLNPDSYVPPSDKLSLDVEKSPIIPQLSVDCPIEPDTPNHCKIISESDAKVTGIQTNVITEKPVTTRPSVALLSNVAVITEGISKQVSDASNAAVNCQILSYDIPKIKNGEVNADNPIGNSNIQVTSETRENMDKQVSCKVSTFYDVSEACPKQSITDTSLSSEVSMITDDIITSTVPVIPEISAPTYPKYLDNNSQTTIKTGQIISDPAMIQNSENSLDHNTNINDEIVKSVPITVSVPNKLSPDVSPESDNKINNPDEETFVDLEGNNSNEVSDPRNEVCVEPGQTDKNINDISPNIDELTIISDKISQSQMENQILDVPLITNELLPIQPGQVSSIADVKHVAHLLHDNERETFESDTADKYPSYEMSSDIFIAEHTRKQGCFDTENTKEFEVVDSVVNSIIDNMYSIINNKNNQDQRNGKIQDNNESGHTEFDFIHQRTIRNITRKINKTENGTEHVCERLKENESMDFFEKLPINNASQEDSIPEFITASQLYNSQESEKLSEVEQDEQEYSEKRAVNTNKRKIICSNDQRDGIVPEKVLCSEQILELEGEHMEIYTGNENKREIACNDGKLTDIFPEKTMCITIVQNKKESDAQTVPDIDLQSVKNTFSSENIEKSENSQDREEKMYCCDMEVCSGSGSMLCQSIEQFKQCQTSLEKAKETIQTCLEEQQNNKPKEVKIPHSKPEREHKSLFPWKITDISELENQLVPEKACYDSGLSNCYPLPVPECAKVRRVGLSRRGRIKTLHPAFRRPES